MGQLKGNRANGDVRGLHTSFGASEIQKAAEATGVGAWRYCSTDYLPLPDTSQDYAPDSFQVAKHLRYST